MIRAVAILYIAAILILATASRPAPAIPADPSKGAVELDTDADRGVVAPPPTALALVTPEPAPTGVSVPGIPEVQAWALAQLGPRQYDCLAAIVNRESRWRVDATNRTTGAYGLPQALPPEKMASAGADWRTNPVTQLRWMIAYVEARYGSACAARAFQVQRGWY